MSTILLLGVAVFFLLLGAGLPTRHASTAAALMCLPPWLWTQAVQNATPAGLSAFDLFLRYAVAASFVAWSLYALGRRTEL